MQDGAAKGSALGLCRGSAARHHRSARSLGERIASGWAGAGPCQRPGAGAGRTMSGLPYRPNVGAVLFNRDGFVFVARRADLPNAEGTAGGWQLPQGGIDPGEDPRAAVLRELAEEIGTDRAEIIGEHPSGWRTTCRPSWWGWRWADVIGGRRSAGSRCALPARTAISGSMPILIPSSTPGGGGRLQSFLPWRSGSSGRSTSTGGGVRGVCEAVVCRQHVAPSPAALRATTSPTLWARCCLRLTISSATPSWTQAQSRGRPHGQHDQSQGL